MSDVKPALTRESADTMTRDTSQRTCSTCKHWERLGKSHYDYRVRDLLPRNENYEIAVRDEDVRIAVCACPAILFFEHPKPGGAAIMDGSEYMGILVTDRDFGCTLHESIEGGVVLLPPEET